MLFNEPKLLKYSDAADVDRCRRVSVLFNEPKLLKSVLLLRQRSTTARFSALQRAEIAEIDLSALTRMRQPLVSVLFNEPKLLKSRPPLHSASLFHIPITTLRRS